MEESGTCIGSEVKKDEGRTADEPAKQETPADPTKFVGCGFTEDGWFQVKIHKKRGLCEILGFLEQAKDIVKLQFGAEAEQREKARLVRPNGLLKGFRNKWQ